MVAAVCGWLREAVGAGSVWFTETAEGGYGDHSPERSQTSWGHGDGEFLKTARVTWPGGQGDLFVDTAAVREWDENAQALLRQAGELLGEALTEMVDKSRAADSVKGVQDALREEKKALLDLLSHELRTPLTSIAAGIELLEMQLDEQDSPQVQVLLARMTRGVERLLILVHNAAALVDGGQRLVLSEETPIDAAAIGVVLDRLEALGALRDIRVRCAPPPAGVHVRVPVEDLHAVLERVVSNAVKFSDPGAHVLVRSTWDEVAGLLRFEVCDEGCGVPAEEVAALGRPFVKSSRTMAAEKPGMGLGLAAARRVTELWGGTVSLVSAEAGTTVVIAVPADSTG